MNNIKAGADIHAGDGGYELSTWEKYEEFVSMRNYPIPKRIYVRSELNRILFGLLGSHSLIDQWWNSNNKGLNDKTPNEVYWSGEEGRVAVADYILKFVDFQV